MKISIKTSKKPEKTGVVFISKKTKIPKSLNAYKKELEYLFKEGLFKGKSNSSFFVPRFSQNPSLYKQLALVGLGDEESLDYESLRQASAKAFKELKLHGQQKADFILENLITKNTPDWEKVCQSITEGCLLSSYKCDEFKKNKDQKKDFEIFLHVPPDQKSVAQKGLRAGEITAEAVNFAKKLANTPGNLMTPSILASEVKKKTQNTKIKTTVWDKKRIEKERMGGLFGVALGSSQEPRFIIMEYRGSSKKPIVFVGKGLTFDSGGISLKPSQNMDEMKFDMCGSTAVIGALLAIEKLQLKVNVTGLIPSSENMPGQSANKPGDILKARNGKTMEVLNTDAEGRLILADALSYASELKPEVIFDAATLTGAIITALGNIFTGFFTKNKDLAKIIQKAGKNSGEKMWQLPLTKEHTKDIKSAIADVANISSGRGASSSTAAAFLEHFVDERIPWAHFDIAGTAWNTHNRSEYCSPKMASGVMVRTFVELAKSYE